MNDHEFAERIVARLDDGLSDLPPQVIGKLQTARRVALDHAGTAPAWRLSLVGDALHSWLFGGNMSLRLGLPAALVVASISGLIYWQTSLHHEDDVEAALLAGELPIHAYMDPGFESWLQNASYTSRQQ
jgi:hypothetical protein